MKKTNKKQAPSKFLLLFEGRALWELGSFYATQPLLNKSTPPGDNHPVLVLPGFFASDKSTRPLRRFLDKKGYQTYGWGLGRNLGRLEYQEKLVDKLAKIQTKHQRKVTIIGWSLGGVYARILANLNPEKVRQVITLGSPFRNLTRRSNAHWLYEYINKEKAGNVPQEVISLVEQKPDVPFTALYTKTDSIVSWQNAIEKETSYYSQNIHVLGSHCGLGHNPMVLYVIADRLSQAENNWHPFEFKEHLSKYFYPDFWQSKIKLAL